MVPDLKPTLLMTDVADMRNGAGESRVPLAGSSSNEETVTPPPSTRFHTVENIADPTFGPDQRRVATEAHFDNLAVNAHTAAFTVPINGDHLVGTYGGDSIMFVVQEILSIAGYSRELDVRNGTNDFKFELNRGGAEVLRYHAYEVSSESGFWAEITEANSDGTYDWRELGNHNGMLTSCSPTRRHGTSAYEKSGLENLPTPQKVWMRFARGFNEVAEGEYVFIHSHEKEQRYPYNVDPGGEACTGLPHGMLDKSPCGATWDIEAQGSRFGVEFSIARVGLDADEGRLYQFTRLLKFDATGALYSVGAEQRACLINEKEQGDHWAYDCSEPSSPSESSSVSISSESSSVSSSSESSSVSSSSSDSDSHDHPHSHPHSHDPSDHSHPELWSMVQEWLEDHSHPDHSHPHDCSCCQCCPEWWEVETENCNCSGWWEVETEDCNC